jgi:hypothetical protein
LESESGDAGLDRLFGTRLEGLIARPEMVIGGPIMNANAKEVFNYGESPDGPPKGQETTSPPTILSGSILEFKSIFII